MDGQNSVRFEVTKYEGCSFDPKTEQRPQRRLSGFLVLSIRFQSRGEEDEFKPPAHNVHTPAGASMRLGFSVKKTMTLAHRLYEAGHITYMRTDSTNLMASPLKRVELHPGELQ